MTTEVILTGTGVPHPPPGRAGAGRSFAAATSRCSSTPAGPPCSGSPRPGPPPHTLTALFVTHVHSDHVVDLPDVVMTRWIQQQLARPVRS